MSAEVRTAIATAASTVDGVNCSPYFRQSGKAGDALVRLDRKARDSSGFGWIVTWQVVVFLPQDLASAEKWMDAHVDALAEALNPELVVTQVTPEQLALDTGTVPVVVIAGTRAE